MTSFRTFCTVFTLVCLPLTQLPALEVHDRMNINGYSSFEYEQQFGNEGKGDPNGSFDADLFDLVFNVDATERLRVAADLTWEHGPASEDDRGNVALEYAFGEYTVFDWLRVRVGKTFIHFGIYNEIHTAKPAFLTVKEPLSSNKNDKFGSAYRFYPRWGTGISLVGNGAWGDRDYDYIVQVVNGEQEKTNPFEEDDNKSKATSGRFRLNPMDGMRVGVSAYRDVVDEWDEEDPDISLGETEIVSFGSQFEYNVSSLGIELEHVYGTVDTTGSSERSRWAMTAMLYWRLTDMFVPYLRYEYLDPDDDIDNDGATMYVYGCNVTLDRGLSLKVELNTIEAEENNARFEGVDYTEAKAAVVISF